MITTASKKVRDVMAGKVKNKKALDKRLVAEWHPTKNGSLEPTQVTGGSRQRIWWLCEHGHAWDAAIRDRSRGEACPYCSGKRVGYGNSLSDRYPTLAKQWHPTKNGSLTPADVTRGSQKKVWWLCAKRHEWKATIKNRAAHGTKCPFCAGRKEHDLAADFPGIAKEWHPTLNGDLSPHDVTSGSHKKVWWKCDKGDEWQASIHDRTSHLSRCPYCFGTSEKRLKRKDSLSVLFPEIAKQWHPTKNGNLSPSKLLPRSSRKVWWQCDKYRDHVWKSTISGRTKPGVDSACPFCLGKRASKSYNLGTLYPKLVKEWHASRNGGLTPYEVTPGTKRKIWWRCKRGHEWVATPLDRTSKSSGCPKCKPQTSRPEIRVFCELKSILGGVKWNRRLQGISCDVYLSNHKIAIEYDGYYRHRGREDKDKLKEQRLAKMGVTLFRIREQGLKNLSERDIVLEPTERDFSVMVKLLNKLTSCHEFSAEDKSGIAVYLASKRLQNDKEFREMTSDLPAPPRAQSLARLYPDISGEWHFERNLPLKPTMFLPGSNDKVWWRCTKGHEWQARIYQRTQGSGCPYCAGNKATEVNNLAVLRADLASEWHLTKNGKLTPSEVTLGSDRRVWWRCTRGHEWRTSVKNRTIHNSGCPYCLGRRASEDNNLETRFPGLAAQWHPTLNGDLKASDVTSGSDKKVWWLCKNNHEWQAIIKNRTRTPGCTQCRKERRKQSSN